MTVNTADTKLTVLKALESNPTLPYSIIAKDLGITRERVRQIAQRNGYPPRRGILKPKTCPVCWETYYTKNKYCSRSCLYEAMRKKTGVNCHQCRKPIKRRASRLHNKTGKYFCSRECYRESQKKQIKEQYEEQIMAAALEVFTRQGYATASIQIIAALAGVSVGTIYNYYTSKHELFITVMKRFFISAPVLEVIDNMPETDIIVSFEQILQNWFQVAGIVPASHIYYLISDIIRDPELRTLWTEQFAQPFFAKTEATYNSMIASGRLRHVSTPIVIRAMLGLFLGFGILNYLEGDESPIIELTKEEISHKLADLVLNGLAPDAAK